MEDPSCNSKELTNEDITQLSTRIYTKKIIFPRGSIKGLMEIQHVTEKHLHQLREQVQNEYEIEVQNGLSKITDQEELQHILQLMKNQK
ncbi:hypothetical protein DOY81_011732 [Sarcophaga bullata]|nr:hypothetical protein DOY81_011732 [Sarcophaga bullata]